MKKNKQRENYLDYIPIYSEKLKWETDEAGNVTIFQENKGVFHKACQVLFKKPKVSQIHLDEMGNFIWPLIDGKRTVGDIALLVKAEFGDKAEPLYNRLVAYMRNLEMYHFVVMRANPQNKGKND
jgi:hypothetical protein